ncbi:hypothetical protein [Bacillus sp. CGMCC 1.16541]|nr:hypothetical protein [Bacillus sp. CGMCC 1.16541]
MKNEKMMRTLTIFGFVLFVSFLTANNVSSNHEHIDVTETFKEVHAGDCK